MGVPGSVHQVSSHQGVLYAKHGRGAPDAFLEVNNSAPKVPDPSLRRSYTAPWSSPNSTLNHGCLKKWSSPENHHAQDPFPSLQKQKYTAGNHFRMPEMTSAPEMPYLPHHEDRKCQFFRQSFSKFARGARLSCMETTTFATNEGYNVSAKAGYYKPVWITTLVLSCTVAYLLFIQIVYLVVNYGRHKRHLFWFDVFCIITALFTYCRLAVPHYNERVACGILHDIEAVSFYLSYFMIWSTLWMRQHYFYKAPAIRTLFSKYVLVLSYGCEIVITLVFVTEIIEYAATRYFGKDGCVHDYFEEGLGSWLVVYVSSIIFQSILVWLLIYPVWIQYKKNINGKCSNSIARMKRLLTRTAMASGLCGIVNAVSLPINIFVLEDIVELQNFLYNINLVMQLVTLLVSFKSWKSRIFFWKIRKRSSNVEIASHHATTLGFASGKSLSCEIVDLRNKT